MLVMTFCVAIQALRVARVQFETKKIRIHAGKNSIISLKCNIVDNNHNYYMYVF